MHTADVRVAFIGGGAAARVHAEALRHLPNVEVVALAEASKERAEESARLVHIPTAVEDYRQVLQMPQVDAVHCCVPNHLHHSIIAEALEAGKHVYAEKPLGNSLGEARSLASHAALSGRLTTVNFHYRYFPLVQEIRQRMVRGELGATRLLRIQYLQDWLTSPTAFDWRLDPGLHGVSHAMMDIGCHCLDLAEYLAGSRIRRLVARLVTLVSVRTTRAADGAARNVDVRTDDYGDLLFETADGIAGIVIVSQVSPGHKNSLSFEVTGSGASAFWCFDSPHEAWLGSRERPNEITQRAEDFRYGWRGGMVELARGFYRDVLAHKAGEPLEGRYPSFEDGARSHVLLQAIVESHRRSQWVEVGN